MENREARERERERERERGGGGDVTEKLLPTEVHVDTDEISIPNTKGISPGGTLLQ